MVYGVFDESNDTKPWVKGTASSATQFGFGDNGANWLGDSGKALESEIDLVEVFGSVPQTLYLAAVAYGGGALGDIKSQAPATWDGDRAFKSWNTNG